jgi:hypothetical protein
VREIYRDRPKKVQTPRIKYTLALPVRAESVAHSLRALREVLRRPFSDENFVTLLRAESMALIPESLRPLLEKGSREHEIN